MGKAMMNLSPKFFTLSLTCVTLIIGMGSSPAFADSIGPVCDGFTDLNLDNSKDSCEGNILTLSYSGTPESMTATTNVWRVKLEIDVTNYASTGGQPGVAIRDVGLKIADTLENASLVSTNAGAGWGAVSNLGVNNGGTPCTGNGGNGFVCSTGGAGATLPFAGTYEWVFDLEVLKNVNLLTAPGAATVKALYIDATGQKTGAITSEPITLMVPIPSTLVLMGMGMVGMEWWRRRTLKKTA